MKKIQSQLTKEQKRALFPAVTFYKLLLLSHKNFPTEKSEREVWAAAATIRLVKTGMVTGGI